MAWYWRNSLLFWWWAYPFLVWSFQRDYVNNCERGRHDMESKVIYGYGYERKNESYAFDLLESINKSLKFIVFSIKLSAVLSVLSVFFILILIA